MSCEEKSQLILEFGNAAESYSAAVKEIIKRMATTPQGGNTTRDAPAGTLTSGYLELMKFTDVARTGCEEARRALDGHTETHGC